MNRLTRSQRIRRLQGLGPSLLALAVFLFVPLIIVVAFSLMKKAPYGGVEPFLSFDAYQQILVNKRLDGTFSANTGLFIILGRSVGLACITTVLCFFIAFPVAFYIARQRDQVKNLLLILVMIPFWSNLLIRTIAWIILLRNTGLVNTVLMWLGFIEAPLTMMFTNGAIVVGLVYVYVPFMLFPIYASIERLDRRQVEASFDLYANRFRTLIHVILPLTRPGIIAGCILVFIPSIGAFITPDLLGGGKKLMIGSLIKMQVTEGRNWPYGAALSTLLLAVVMLALYFWARSASARKGR